MRHLRRRINITAQFWSSGATNDRFPDWKTSNLTGDQCKSKPRSLDLYKNVLTRFLVNHHISYVSPKQCQVLGKLPVQGINLTLVRLHSLSHISADSGRLFPGRKISRLENRSLANPNRDYLPTLEEEAQHFHGMCARRGHSKGRWDGINEWVLESEYCFKVWKASALTVGQTVAYVK
jgi:hypothetical protein